MQEAPYLNDIQGAAGGGGHKASHEAGTDVCWEGITKWCVSEQEL